MRTYEEYKSIVDKNLIEYLPEISNHAKLLKDAMEYSLNQKGKRLRPVLLLAACEFSGGDINDAIPFACATEYIHTYSLIHDDLPAMDDDELRRGEPTNHIVFGEANAILAGDGLLNTAFQIMTERILTESKDVDKMRKMLEAMHIIAKASGIQGMVAGQVKDMESETKAITNEELEFIHENKTAKLILAPLMAGLELGFPDNEMRDAVRRYGEALGVSFQIADDILDVEGDTEKLGKNTGQDEKHNKTTAVSICGLEGAKEKLFLLSREGSDAIKKYEGEDGFFTDLILKLSKREM